jgi:hypothetical protein
MLRIAADGVAAGTDEGRFMAVSEARQAADAAFAAEVEAQRQALQPDAPPIVAEGGCGAGETPHRFELQPADGEARVIRAFSFDLCAARRLNPWDTERCRGWVAVRDGGSLALSGTYRVQARWPDGRSLRTDVTAQGFGEDAPPVRLAAPARGAEGAGRDRHLSEEHAPCAAGWRRLRQPAANAVAGVAAAAVAARHRLCFLRAVLLGTLFVWEWVRNASTRTRRRWMLAALVLTLGGIGAYLVGYSLFVENVPGTDARVIRGYECTREAALVHGAACPDLPRDALRDAEWEAPLLWTRGSLTAVRLGLAASWLMFTVGLIASIGAVVAGREFAARPRRRQGGGAEGDGTTAFAGASGRGKDRTEMGAEGTPIGRWRRWGRRLGLPGAFG